MKSITPLFVALLSIFLLGCDNSNFDVGYKAGYDEGKKVRHDECAKAGYDRGHADGYREATEKAFPGNGTTRAGWHQILNVFMAVLCAAKVVISILVAIFYLTFASASHKHTVGKALMGTLGGLFAFWIANTFDLFSTGTIQTGAKAFLLAPAAVSVLGHTGWTLAALVPAFLAFWYFDSYVVGRAIESIVEDLFGSPKKHPWKDGLHVFALTFLLAVLLPVFFNCYGIPDIARYRGFDLAFGWLLGTILYVAVRFMAREPQPPSK
ncbi:MAG: hypothetical protein HY301_20410 [Verrucomicrobia bacterium]|nr:hypothetical protein [Verrucomicrobiota bacterium]